MKALKAIIIVALSTLTSCFAVASSPGAKDCYGVEEVLKRSRSPVVTIDVVSHRKIGTLCFSHKDTAILDQRGSIATKGEVTTTASGIYDLTIVNKKGQLIYSLNGRVRETGDTGAAKQHILFKSQKAYKAYIGGSSVAIPVLVTEDRPQLSDYSEKLLFAGFISYGSTSYELTKPAN
jgi:hypothetical protein